VVGDVQPEHLLLEAELDPLAPLVVLDLVTDAVAADLLPTEQRELAHLLVAAAGGDRIHDLLEAEHQALAGISQAVEAARLDQRFDGALVEGFEVDPLAEVGEVRVRTVGTLPATIRSTTPSPTLRTALIPNRTLPCATVKSTPTR
jgi:hypothetical protein